MHAAVVQLAALVHDPAALAGLLLDHLLLRDVGTEGDRLPPDRDLGGRGGWTIIIKLLNY